MAVDAQGLFGSVVHDADPNPIAARGLFASVVHSGILNPVSARGLFASVVHDTSSPPSPTVESGQILQGYLIQGAFQDQFQGDK